MIQSSHKLSLVLESIRKGGVLTIQTRRENLNGDRSFETVLNPFVNGTHAATTQQPLNRIARHHRLELRSRRRLPSPISTRGARWHILR